MSTLRIMTYNVQRCRGSDGKVNADRTMNVIADAVPGVVALQEIGFTDQPDPLPYLAERLGMTQYRDPAGCPGAFLSHLPLKGVQRHDLGFGGYCLRADVELSGKRLHLLNICLDSAPRFRSRQVSHLLGPDLLGNPSMVCPALVIGDFADYFWGAGNLELASVLRKGRRPWWCSTYPASFPVFGRDRAYLRGGVRILEASINHSYLARQASTHLPLTLTVQITDLRRFLKLENLARSQMEAAPG